VIVAQRRAFQQAKKSLRGMAQAFFALR